MRSTSDIINISFGIVMIVMVIAGALVFSLTDFMDERLYGRKRVIFVVILVAYGVYRIFRLLPLLNRRREIE